MLVLDIFSIVAKMFERINIFNDMDIKLFIVSFAKELTFVEELSFVKELFTKSLIARSNRRIIWQNILKLVSYSIS